MDAKRATGRATCRICRQKIKKGMVEIVWYGYHMERHLILVCRCSFYHRICVSKLKVIKNV